MACSGNRIAVEVKRIKGKGRGVFARRSILKGEVIERSKTDLCAVLVKLKGAGDITVECCFGEAYTRTTEKV